MLLERLGTPRVGEVEAAGDIEVARGASFALHRAAEPDATAEQILAAQRIAIFFDVLASAFVLWAAMGRDIRRFYEPSMEKAVFETGLRYYLWGGKESYNIRQQMRERAAAESAAHTEKTAEIDHGSAHLPVLVDEDIDDTTQVLPGTAADLLAERTLNVVREQNRSPGVLAVMRVPGCGRCRPGLMDVLGQGSRRGQRTNACREDSSGKKVATHGDLPIGSMSVERESHATVPVR